MGFKINIKKYIDPKIIEDKKRGFGIPLNQLIKKELKPWVFDTITLNQTIMRT